MIKGHCKTNLDEFKREEWPTIFYRVPEKGERVQAKSGKNLRVIQITHTLMPFSRGSSGIATSTEEPFIIVELHQ